ncbi:MAG: LicD family protein [Lachnospiraceae bacterium]|nr:LicD family protein [Lachnospiraceae bacterium]MBQ1172465.1 LicD family protein [Lachnospiraceae bacterium]
MMNYPENYFKEEVRCGFRITEMMKRNWASQLEVLSELERICKKYNLEYFAGSGTLLGAVRHKGFIPWDDDIDVAMKRSDYMKLMNVIVQEMPSDFWVKTIYNAQDWDNTFARVVNTKTIPLSGEKLERFHGAPFATGLDIFPMDYLPKDKELERVQIQLLDLADKMIVNLLKNKNGWYKDGGEEIQENIKQELSESFKIFAEFGALPSSLEGKSIMQIFQLIYDQLCMFGTEDGDRCVFFNTMHRKGFHKIYRAEWFDEIIDMPFEYGTIRVPAAYDEILTIDYNNYMKFTLSGSFHGYPVYKNQLQRLIDAKKWDGKIDPKDLGIQDEQKENVNEAGLVEKWEKQLSDRNRENKKIVLFESMITALLRWEEKYLDVLEIILEKIVSSNKLFLWWRPFVNENTPYRDVRPELFDRYSKICEKYKSNLNMIYDDSDTNSIAMELCDVYLGDDCMIGDEMKKKYKKCYIIDMKSGRPENIVKKIK